MREVICDTCGVVHVAVGQQDVVYRDNLVGGFADVEADVELWYGYYGFLGCDGIADDVHFINL